MFESVVRVMRREVKEETHTQKRILFCLQFESFDANQFSEPLEIRSLEWLCQRVPPVLSACDPLDDNGFVRDEIANDVVSDVDVSRLRRAARVFG